MARRPRSLVLVLAGLAVTAGLAACSSTPAASSGPSATSSNGAPATTTTTADEPSETTTTKKGSGGTGSSAGPTGVNADGEITDGRTIRAFLYSVIQSWGEQALDPEDLAKGLRDTYAELNLSGSGRESTSTKISIYSNRLMSKESLSDTNPNVIAFAVLDVKGTCVGGVIYGNPLPVTTLDLAVESGDPCNADAMVEVATPKMTAG